MNSNFFRQNFILLLVSTSTVFAVNAPDYAESFELYSDGFTLPGTNGWSAAAPDNAVVSADEMLVEPLKSYGEPCGYPLPVQSHNKILELGTNGSVTNQFNMADNQIIWMDCMLLPVQGPLPAGINSPAGMQAAVAFDLERHPAVWHYDIAAASNRWSVVDDLVFNPWDWVRLTLKLDYQTEDTINSKRYFQVRLNGILLTHPNAWTANDGSGSPGGSWFAMPSNPDSFGRFSCKVNDGISAALDDLVVTTNNPLSREVVITSALGQADPAIGTHTYTYGDTLSLSLTNSPLVQGTSQFVLAGWDMAGHDPASGTDASIQITLTNDLSLTWVWSTNNSLTANGTPIWWLTDHGLTTGDDSFDSDNDGMPTWKEWTCDTDPTDENSILECTSIEAAAPGMNISWKGGILATQVLERCTNLVSGSWNSLFTNAPPTPIATGFTDHGATNAAMFYRIKASR